MKKQIILYGIGGPDKAYRVLEYFTIFDITTSDDLINDIWNIAARLAVINPSIKRVFAISNRRGLRGDYMEAQRRNSIESHIVFKDILEREGRVIPV